MPEEVWIVKTRGSESFVSFMNIIWLSVMSFMPHLCFRLLWLKMEQ
jgi:hypothetical protein